MEFARNPGLSEYGDDNKSISCLGRDSWAFST